MLELGLSFVVEFGGFRSRLLGHDLLLRLSPFIVNYARGRLPGPSLRMLNCKLSTAAGCVSGQSLGCRLVFAVDVWVLVPIIRPHRPPIGCIFSPLSPLSQIAFIHAQFAMQPAVSGILSCRPQDNTQVSLPTCLLCWESRRACVISRLFDPPHHTSPQYLHSS